MFLKVYLQKRKELITLLEMCCNGSWEWMWKAFFEGPKDDIVAPKDLNRFYSYLQAQYDNDAAILKVMKTNGFLAVEDAKEVIELQQRVHHLAECMGAMAILNEMCAQLKYDESEWKVVISAFELAVE